MAALREARGGSYAQPGFVRLALLCRSAGARAELRTTVSDVVTALSNSTNTGVAAVGTALSALDATRQSAWINTLAGAVNAPVLNDILSMSGQYYAFPILKATPTTPEPGVYKGTMTVTFVQQ